MQEGIDIRVTLLLHIGMDAIASAIADPTRRGILDALVVRNRTAGELAALFPISRPAVSRHLRLLREAGLVEETVVGRHHHYALCREALAPLAQWINGFGTRNYPIPDLDALETEVRRATRDRRLRHSDLEETG